MNIQHIASGSSGNSIVVDDGFSKLMFDAGLSYSKLSKRVRFSEISGVFITHEHGDHSKAVPELLRRGVNVYMSPGTARNIDHNFRFLPLHHIAEESIGSWKVLPFNVEHDAAEPLGFLFESQETGSKGVYIADSAFVNYNFTGVTHFIIEANYSEELLNDSDDPDWLKDRIRKSHFSFDDLCRFLDDSDLSKTEEIHLIHLSSRNSNEVEFKERLQKRYGIPTFTISDSEKNKTVVG